MHTLFLFINYNLLDCNFYILRNKYLCFCFLQTKVNQKRIFKLCFFLSKNNKYIFYNQLDSIIFLLPKVSKISILPFFNSLYKAMFFLNFNVKTRIRFSGLGYGLEKINDDSIDKVLHIKINVGLTHPPVIKLPFFVFTLKTNRRKKKIQFEGSLKFLINSFAANIIRLRHCDVYKHKGIRWRLEKVRTKEGKRSGKR